MGGEWLIGANTQNIPFNCSNTTQDKIKASKAPIDERFRFRFRFRFTTLLTVGAYK